MSKHPLEPWRHTHDFSVHNEKGERRTHYVLLLTAITMVVEIIAGSLYGSMALLADGWHMSTHVAAFLITIFAYRFARKNAENPNYSFGTGKVNVLGGFTSAIVLFVVALIMLVESLHRFIEPQTILFNEAIFIACLGLVINLVSALILKDDHHHHDHDHSHDHHHDHNLKAAYLHVLADAMTSLLAIVALVSGKYFGWNWLDPMMGIVGAIIISRWSYSLLKTTGPILLDASIDEDYKQAIKQAIEADADAIISDIHIWKVGANHYAAIIALVSHNPMSTEHYKSRLSQFHKLSHITIEINQCQAESCLNQ